MFWLDLNDVALENKKSVLPEGKYTLAVNNAEEALTKKGDDMLKLRFVVMDGKYKDRYIFENYMLSGNAKAVDIARKSLKNLLISAGKKSFNLASPKDFIGLVVSAHVKIVKQEGFSDVNKISGFSDADNFPF